MTTTPRRCGSCAACCTVLGVTELAKAEHVRCAHIRGHGGCGIYADRPASCVAYRCRWLYGAGAVDDRPDRLGIILDTVPALDGGEDVIVAREVRVGAFEAGRGAHLLATIEAKTIVVRAFLDGTRNLHGSASRVSRLVALHHASGKALPR